MRGLGKVGRLVAGLLLAVAGLTANTMASAASTTLVGTNITAVVTSTPDPWGADKITGVYDNVTLEFKFTRTSSDSLSNGEFELNLTGVYSPGSILLVTNPSSGASCVTPVAGATRAYCTIDAVVNPVTIQVVVQPTSPFLTYSWSVRPGTGTNNPPWLGQSSVSLTASGDSVAGATGQDGATVTAETTVSDGLKGLVTAQGKSGTGSMFVSVQEFLEPKSPGCNELVPYYACVKFSAEKSDGTKLKYPDDLSKLLSFAVAVDPTLPGLQGKTIKSIKLYYFSVANDPNPTALKNCTKGYSRAYSSVPCIDSRFSDSSTSLWIFSLLGWENGFVTVYD